MGLDMYAYSAAEANQEYTNTTELAYWRKHPNLHGWMEQLWRSKNNTGDLTDPMFNGVELELNWEDLDRLERDVRLNLLPATAGFFFGNPADDYYMQQDLEFVRKARTDIFTGLRVFYNSSW